MRFADAARARTRGVFFRRAFRFRGSRHMLMCRHAEFADIGCPLIDTMRGDGRWAERSRAGTTKAPRGGIRRTNSIYGCDDDRAFALCRESRRRSRPGAWRAETTTSRPRVWRWPRPAGDGDVVLLSVRTIIYTIRTGAAPYSSACSSPSSNSMVPSAANRTRWTGANSGDCRCSSCICATGGCSNSGECSAERSSTNWMVPSATSRTGWTTTGAKVAAR